VNQIDNHQARKRFGQNFLVDTQVVDNIIAAIRPVPGDNLVEIGPGQGAITGPLLARGGRLHAVEVDRDLAALLGRRFADNSGFVLHLGDALAFDFSQLPQPLRVVGNLPYNISTPLLFHLLNYASGIRDMHFMLQKEVVDRMAAAPGSKTYGRLSVIVQYYCEVCHLFNVPASAFRPVPKVESAIVRLIPRPDSEQRARDNRFFETLVKTAFQQRRKTLRNTLKQLPGDWDLNVLSIDLSLRPEVLTISQFVTLSNELDQQR
jgi:16S rRNA (adenine1518-N6/adenine1519-N6)-dimethyltransferase